LVLWSSGVVMSLAQVLRQLVAAQWLYEETGSAAQLGLLGAVQLLQLPVSLYGGTLADRFDRKKLMVLPQAASLVVLIMLAGLAASDALKPWHIFAATGAVSMVSTLGGSARPAMIRRVVPQDLVTQAVATLNITSQVSIIIGPLFFWAVYDLLGAAVAFGVAAFLAAVSAATPLLIRASGKPEQGNRQTTLQSLKEGLRYVLKHPLMPGLFGLDIGVQVVTYYRHLFPAVARELYRLGAQGTGTLNAANSTGRIIGTLLVFWLDKMPRKGLMVLIATLAFAFLIIAFGLNRSYVLGLGIVVLLGLTDAVSVTMRTAIVQLATPDQLIGRASSVRNFSAGVADNLGQIEVGIAAAALGAGNAMVMGGLISVFFVIGVWRLVPSIARYRYAPATEGASVPATPPR
jgi:MFS family permease